MGPLEVKGLILALGVMAGMGCIFLGYKLYAIGVVQKGQLNAQGLGARVSLKDYGPGVAFALFGAAIIAFALTRQMSQTTDVKYTAQPPIAAGQQSADVVQTSVANCAPSSPLTLTCAGQKLSQPLNLHPNSLRSPAIAEKIVTQKSEAVAPPGGD
jgi:hypothetical protein